MSINVEPVVTLSWEEFVKGVKDRHAAVVLDVSNRHQKVVDYFNSLPPINIPQPEPLEITIKPLNAPGAALDPNAVAQAVADTIGPQLQQQQNQQQLYQQQQQLAAYNQQPYMQGCGCGCPCQCHAYHQALHGQPAQQYYVSAQQQPGLGIMRLT